MKSSYDDPGEYLYDAAVQINKGCAEMQRTLKLCEPRLLGHPFYARYVRLQFHVEATAAMARNMSEAADIVIATADKIRPMLDTANAVTPDVTRPCACGCGQSVTSARPEARYASTACRVRAHRARATVSPAPARHRGQIP